MKQIIRNAASGIVAFALTITTIISSSQPAFADDGQPPTQLKEEIVASGQVASKVTLQGPSRGILGPLPGPGGQSGVLSSMISWYGTYWVKGGSEISLTGGPTAKTWTTLAINGAQAEMTGPCWTTTKCTIWTSVWRPAVSGTTVLNFAETTVYWSGGGSTNANATVTKTF